MEKKETRDGEKAKRFKIITGKEAGNIEKD